MDPATEGPGIAESISPACPTDAQAAAAAPLQTDLGAVETTATADAVVLVSNSTLTVTSLAPGVTSGDGTVPSAPAARGGGPGGAGQPLLPPVIIEFHSQSQGDAWLFSGTVLDDKDVTGLTVHFGGLLAGKSAVVNEHGFFELLTILPPGISGTVSAYTIDSDGLRSEVVTLLIG